MPVPAPLIVLVAASLLAGITGTLDVHAAEPAAVAALVVLLFNGGVDIGWSRMRPSLGPVLSAGIAGTCLTTGVIALAAHAIVGLDWTTAGLVGAALASTDPAMVFSVLRGQRLKGRTGTILEGEAGFNDPASIALMLGMIELATHDEASFLVVVSTFVVQMGLGALFGTLAAPAFRRLHRPSLLLLAAGALYGVTALCGGSGFLAVFVVGLLIADDLAGLHGAIANAGELLGFGALGLTVALTQLPATTWRDGAILVAAMALVARPLTVATTLPTLPRNDRLFAAWCGLKGANPLLLGTFAVLEPVPHARRIYDLVFVGVVLSVLAQGTFVPALAKRLDLLVP
jgi:cell volume regulation protein A